MKSDAIESDGNRPWFQWWFWQVKTSMITAPNMENQAMMMLKENSASALQKSGPCLGTNRTGNLKKCYCFSGPELSGTAVKSILEP